MKLGVFLNTPAQVHFYKNIIKSLLQRGNEVYPLARDYGETLDLLRELKIDHYVYSWPSVSKYSKVAKLPKDIIYAYNYLKAFDVDLITGFGVYDAYTSFLLKVPSIVFNDTEPLINMKSYAIQFKLYMPFVDLLITPESFRQNMGNKQIRVNSYKELAYLHPNSYKPNKDIFKLLGVNDGDDYCLLRFNAFDALHDLSIRGFSDSDKINLVECLEKYSKIFISSEANISDNMKKYIIKIPKSRIHDVIYFAKLMVTDAQTMATEAAILGTPTIRCNSYVGVNDMGNFIELENHFGLMFNYNNSQDAIKKALELIKQKDLKSTWKIKCDILLKDKIDITEFMVWLLEEYPNSLQYLRENPNDFDTNEMRNYGFNGSPDDNMVNSQNG